MVTSVENDMVVHSSALPAGGIGTIAKHGKPKWNYRVPIFSIPSFHTGRTVMNGDFSYTNFSACKANCIGGIGNA